MVKDNHVICPKCNSQTWKFGIDPLTKSQRYRCKNIQNCGYQFVPHRPPRIKKYPSFICPKCGSNMTIFKHLSDGFRLRCNRHNAKGNKKCTHKINVPFPGRAFKIAKDPLEAIDVNDLAVPFCWNKMDFSRDTVAIVAFLAVTCAIPSPQTVMIMQQLFNVQISHDTVTRWRHKAVLNIHKNLGPLRVPYSRHKRLFTDETQFKTQGLKRWVWAGKESKFDSIQTFFISPRRCTEFARSTLNIAFENSPALRQANVVTDGLHSYPCALDDLGYDRKTNTSGTSAGTGTPLSESITTDLKDNGLTSKPPQDHSGDSKASWACGVLLPPESTGTTILCRTKDSMEKLLLKL